MHYSDDEIVQPVDSEPEPEPEPPPAPPPKAVGKPTKITRNQQVTLLALYTKLGYTPAATRHDVKEGYGVPMDDLTGDQFEELKAVLTERRTAEVPKADAIPF